MKQFKRIFLIVIDSLGIGEMPDSASFGDVGVNTLQHVSEQRRFFAIPNLFQLGLGNLTALQQYPSNPKAMGRYTRLQERSSGKDTMTGHWEMMGLWTTKPFITFTDHGFPPELIAELERRTGRKIIGNKSASGTEILEELGEREIQNGELIVYTSADSVLQICGNEETISEEGYFRSGKTGAGGCGRHHGTAECFVSAFPCQQSEYRRKREPVLWNPEEWECGICRCQFSGVQESGHGGFCMHE